VDIALGVRTGACPQGVPNNHLILEGANNPGVEIVPAATPALLERVYRLRYEVYCVAHHFEDPNYQIEGFEQDKYDEYARHSLVFDRPSGAALGSVRLILPNDNTSLPSYTLCPAAAAAADVMFPRATTAEASRFLRAIDVPGTPSRQPVQETLALMAALVKMSAENGISHVLALVTKSMLRLLNRFGLAFKPLGDPVEFNGLRYASIVDLTVDLSTVAVEQPEVWRILTADGLYYGSSCP